MREDADEAVADSPGERDPSTILRTAREQVLDVLLRRLPWAVIAVVVVFSLQTYGSALSWLPVLGLALFASPLVILGLARRHVSYRVRLYGLLGALGVLFMYTTAQRGATPGGALLSITLILLTGLFFGPRATAWALAGCGAALAIGAVAYTLGLHIDHDVAMFDLSRPLVWVRYAALLVFLGGPLTSALNRLLASLEQALAQLAKSRDAERAALATREQAQRELERQQRLDILAQLAGGMAHDFNNCLMVVMSGAELIAIHPEASTQVRRIASQILDTAQLSAASVRRTLALGRRSSEAQAPSHDVDLAELTSWLARTSAHLLPENVSLRSETDGDGSLSIDAPRVQQALLNLAINARDAMPSGGIVTVRCALREVAKVPPGWDARPGCFAQISIEDTGCGMDPQTVERIFDPFFTTKAEGKGTGLGLSAARSAVRDAHGFLEVTSHPGIGTRFDVYLPCRARVSEDPSRPLPVAASAAPRAD